MHPAIRSTALSPLLLMACLLPAVLVAAEGTEPDAAHSDAPESSSAMDQLMRMAQFMSQLEQFSVALQSAYDVVQDSGEKIEFSERRELVMIRPDRLRVDVERSDGEAQRVTFDGQSISVFNATRNLYASSEIEGDVDAAIMHFVNDLKMRLPLAMLLVSTLPDEIETRVSAAEIVEIAFLGGKPLVHVAARTESVDFQVWLPEDGDPLPRRVVITYKHESGQPQYRADFSDWNLRPSPLASLVAFDIPSNANRIQFLSEIIRAANASESGGEIR